MKRLVLFHEGHRKMIRCRAKALELTWWEELATHRLKMWKYIEIVWNHVYGSARQDFRQEHLNFRGGKLESIRLN